MQPVFHQWCVSTGAAGAPVLRANRQALTALSPGATAKDRGSDPARHSARTPLPEPHAGEARAAPVLSYLETRHQKSARRTPVRVLLACHASVVREPRPL